MRGVLIASLAVAIVTTVAPASAQSGGGEYPMREPPQYPGIAAFWGIEADCLIEYDLTDDGMTENVCASCSTTSGGSADLFIRAAEASVEGWLFAPLDHPEAVSVRIGWETRLEFRLEDEFKGALEGQDTPRDIPPPPPPICDAIA